MRYLLTKEDVQAINEAGIEILTTTDLYGRVVTEYEFNRCADDNEKVFDLLCPIKFGLEFEDWKASKQQLKYKIYQFVDGLEESCAYNPPVQIDFISGLITNLHKKVLPKVKGIPTTVEYYEKCEVVDDVAVYENLIVKIDFALVYNALGFMVSKTRTFTWLLENNQESKVTKTIVDKFTMNDDFDRMLKEGILRRQNIVDDIQYPVLKMLSVIFPDKQALETVLIGREFLAELDETFKGFIERAVTVTNDQSEDYGKKIAYIVVRDYNGIQASWLDTEVEGTTPRQFVMNALDI